MFSSKIIKRKDREKSNVRAFSLRQFPGDEDKGANQRGRAKDSPVKKHVDAVRDVRVQAQHEAQLLLDTARHDAKRIQQEAFEQGYAAGAAEGRRSVEAELAPLLEALARINEDFACIKEGFYTDHQDIILELALKIARKVIHQEIVANEELVITILTTAIKLAMDRERLKIRIHPDDLAVCLQRRQDIMKTVDGIKQLLFEPDEAIGKGGALIEYSFGEIDARIEQQFAELERELRDTHLDMEELAAP
jgi:flagellar assembly protein FliH